MKKSKIFIVFLLALLGVTVLNLPMAIAQELSECEKAGGEIQVSEECDGSQSQWCYISTKEQCYADQVKDGKCTVGEYSEELGGIIGITPRVLCQEGELGGDD